MHWIKADISTTLYSRLHKNCPCPVLKKKKYLSWTHLPCSKNLWDAKKSLVTKYIQLTWRPSQQLVSENDHLWSPGVWWKIDYHENFSNLRGCQDHTFKPQDLLLKVWTHTLTSYCLRIFKDDICIMELHHFQNNSTPKKAKELNTSTHWKVESRSSLTAPESFIFWSHGA